MKKYILLFIVWNIASLAFLNHFISVVKYLFKANNEHVRAMFIGVILVFWLLNLSRCLTTARISRPNLFCEKDVLKSFAKFTRKDLCWSLFSIKLYAGSLQFYQKKSGTVVSRYFTWRSATLLTSKSVEGVFLWIFRNF